MTELWYTAADGTTLFARDEGPHDNRLTPLLCLAGLTRNSRDFEPVFDRHAKQRRVVAIDFRGRGRSAKAVDSSSYRVDVELQDTVGFLTSLKIGSVALLGTSRGGIVGMLMAAYAKQFLAGLMLNDVGCELQTDGYLRIKDYVGKPKCHATWDQAAEAVAAGSKGFTNVSHAEWLSMVQRIYVETDAGICPAHDPRLADTLPTEDAIKTGKVGELWSVLQALHDVPFSLLRGAGSDLLTVETVQRMQREAPNMDATTIPDRGHVPFLDEPSSVAAIDRWLQRVDQGTQGR